MRTQLRIRGVIIYANQNITIYNVEEKLIELWKRYHPWISSQPLAVTASKVQGKPLKIVREQHFHGTKKSTPRRFTAISLDIRHEY